MLHSWKIFPQSYRSRSNFSAIHQHRFNFTGFNPEAPQLHLCVDSTQEFDFSIRITTHQIACSIKSLRFGAVNRQQNEFLLRQLWPPQVATRESNSTETYLTCNS